jgi:protein-S-isoprenylcysteine O-methyltransferase Ste14
MENLDKKLFRRYVITEIISLAGMGVALFWSAGKIDWWPAWASLVVMLGWLAATAYIIYKFNPGLLKDRLESRKGAKTWDAVIVSSMGLVTLIRYIIAGLDERHGWSGEFPIFVQIIAFFICALGYALFTWATASNAFFSRVLRIQSERGHQVVSSGPYHYVRHPAYLGAILYELAVSFLYASWWAMIVSTVSAILLIIRTGLEDSTLQNELLGYGDYARKVKYRLIPGIW